MAAVASLELDAPPPSLLSRAARVEAALRAAAPSPRTRTGAMGAYHMGWVDSAGRPTCGVAGKMLRGGLVLWASEATGGEASAALDVAVAVEWVHNFTLVHDDIQDGDRERRHRPAVWTLWGVAQGINAGDALFGLAHARLTAPGPRPARRLRAAHALDRAVLEVIEGQCLDLDLEGRVATSRALYLRLARAKTGALFGASLEAGALLGGAPRRLASQLGRIGRELGAAFQVRDDWLGTFGDPTITGKPRGADVARRKLTAVVVTAHAEATPSLRRRLRTLFARSDDAATEELLAIIHAVGAAEQTDAWARSIAAPALEAVDSLSLPAGHVEELAGLGRYAITRRR